MRERRKIAGFLALVIFLSALGMPIPAEASEIWPQKATAPFYCLDGGKSWRQSDRYDIYKYDTLPSPLTEEQVLSAAYDQEADISFLSNSPQAYFNVCPGQFVLYLPGEGHAPAITTNLLKKAVFKVKYQIPNNHA